MSVVLRVDATYTYHKQSTLSPDVSTLAEVPWYCCDFIVLPCINLNWSTLPTCHAFVHLKTQISPTLIELHTTGNGASTSRA